MKKFEISSRHIIRMLETVKNHRIQFYTDGDDLEVSDGYHTMHELYQHRMALTVALFHSWYIEYGHEPEWQIFKSKFHSDGTMFEGYFIVMAIVPSGQISYHYDLKHWDLFKIPEVERAPEYDGHTSDDVIERLLKL